MTTQKKKPSELTGAELNQFAQVCKRTISELQQMKTAGMSQEERRERNQLLQQAIALGAELETERIRRLIIELQKRTQRLTVTGESQRQRPDQTAEQEGEHL